jgi:CheY-like chemotaxis protein
MSVTYFCPNCNSNQPTFEYYEGDRLKVRCQVCGYPVDEPVVRGEAAITFSRPKILCIDDAQATLDFYMNILEPHDLRVITATDGPSGIETAKKQRPDLIFLDILMPNMDGFEVCRRMRADPDLKDIPIIIVTATEDPKLNIKGFQAGANLAIRKPFEAKKLVGTIRAALALKAKPATNCPSLP